MAVRVSPCGWDLAPKCCRAWDEASEEDREWAAAIATELLWRLSGRRFGLCEITVRPCRAPCPSTDGGPAWPTQGGYFRPRLDGGRWINGCGSCVGECACGPMCEIHLPGPVHDIVRVMLDGVELDPAAYRVDDHYALVRTDGGCWPDCQALSLPPSEPGTLAVTYRHGVPVPPGGIAAASSYACELAKLLCPPGSGMGQCRLPARVQTITREGVTMAMLDPMDHLENGLTGLPEVDAWVAAVNPARLPQASRVYSPDLTPPRVTTWP